MATSGMIFQLKTKIISGKRIWDSCAPGLKDLEGKSDKEIGQTKINEKKVWKKRQKKKNKKDVSMSIIHKKETGFLYARSYKLESQKGIEEIKNKKTKTKTGEKILNAKISMSII